MQPERGPLRADWSSLFPFQACAGITVWLDPIRNENRPWMLFPLTQARNKTPCPLIRTRRRCAAPAAREATRRRREVTAWRCASPTATTSRPEATFPATFWPVSAAISFPSRVLEESWWKRDGDGIWAAWWDRRRWSRRLRASAFFGLSWISPDQLMSKCSFALHMHIRT